MQLRNFSRLIRKIFVEADKLQRRDINGNLLTSRRFTDTQIISLFIAATSLFLLVKGFTDNFAGFIISFLGIFIGLFASIVISMYDKRKALLENLEDMDQLDKARAMQVRNYMIQFTGLTSYSIFTAIVLIVMLSIVLLHDVTKTNVWNYRWISSLKEIDVKAVGNFFKVSLLLFHRFCIVYLLSNFFVTTAFAIASYFSFLLSEYKRIRVHSD